MAVLAIFAFVVLGLAAAIDSVAMATEPEPALAKDDAILDTFRDVYPNWRYVDGVVTYLDSDANLTLLNDHDYYGRYMPSKSYWNQFRPTSGIWAMLHPSYVFESPTPTINFTPFHHWKKFELMTIRCHLYGESHVEVRVDGGKEVVGQITSECKSEGDCRTKGFQDFDVDLLVNEETTTDVEIIFKTVNESDFILVDKIMLFAKPLGNDTSENATEQIPVCFDHKCTPINLLDLEEDDTSWSNKYPEYIQYFETGSEAYNSFLASHNTLEPGSGLPPPPEPEVTGAQGVWLFSSDWTNGSSPHFFLGNIGGHISNYRPVLRVAFDVYLANANASVVLGVMNRDKEWTNDTVALKAEGEDGFRKIDRNFKDQDIVAVQLWPIVLTNMSFVLVDKLEAEVDCDSGFEDDYTECELEEELEATTSTMSESSGTGSPEATSAKPSTRSPDFETSTSGAIGSTTICFQLVVIATSLKMLNF